MFRTGTSFGGKFYFYINTPKKKVFRKRKRMFNECYTTMLIDYPHVTREQKENKK